MPGRARRRLPERLPRGALRPPAPRRPRVGALLHPAQDHGRPPRHAHARGQRAGPGRAEGHGAGGPAAGRMPLGEAHMARVLEREYGGMNEVLYNLGAVTGDASYFELARQLRPRADLRARWREGRDELKGLHANTTIPKIIGAARRYELTGEPPLPRRRRTTSGDTVTEAARRTAPAAPATGRVGGRDPGRLATELSGYTQECCCTYNMLKLTRHLFAWTADPRCADYYERALLNGILGTQHPRDGMNVYYVPLASGYWKLFGRPHRGLLVLHRHRPRVVRQARRQRLLPGRRRPLRESLHALRPGLARARGDPRAGDALPRGGDARASSVHAKRAAAVRPARARALLGRGARALA